MNNIGKITLCLLILTMFILPVSALENNIGMKEQQFSSTLLIEPLEERTTANNAVEWVIMFYQCGDNALSAGISVCLNLIGKVGATDTVKIAVLIDKKPINETSTFF